MRDLPPPPPAMSRRHHIPFHQMSSPSRASSAEVFVDLSDNNGTYAAQPYSAAGHLLVAIKATESDDYINSKWRGWVDASHAHRLGVAHYHFCRPENGNPVGQARYFWDAVRPAYHHHTDRLVLDLETGDQADWPAWLREFDGELHRYSTLKAIGYTFASANLAQLVLHSRKWWLASWGAEQPSGALRRLPGRQVLWGWQYTDGKVNPAHGATAAAGVSGLCDHSVLSPGIVRLLRHELKR
jgi:GH25 family lysozyme M1 (1,4-beta-N-acetylmuramidase)